MNGTSHLMDEMVLVMIEKADLDDRMWATHVSAHSLAGTWLKVVFEVVLNKSRKSNMGSWFTHSLSWGYCWCSGWWCN